MTIEQLMKAGLTEDQAKAVMKLHQESIDGNYVPKATFDAEREKVKAKDTTIQERDTQIKELGKFKGTAEELQTKVTQLETDNKEAKKKYDADIVKTQKEAAVKLDLTGKVYDPNDVISKLNMDNVVFKDGKIVSGYQDQVDELKKNSSHYFKPDDSGEGNKGKIPGWIFGNTPKEGSDEGKNEKGSQNNETDFGKKLAEMKTSSQSASVKAAEVYFK